MSDTSIKILFQGFQLLDEQSKKKLFELIKSEQEKERYNKLLSGVAVEYMNEEEQQILNMAKDLRENAVYLDP